LAIILRFWQFTKVPVALNRDEASLAYNAFAILQTARDEHGRFLPLQIESFGDWKLPGYVYTLVPFIAIFGLEDWVIKLPSALASLGIIVFGFLLVKKWSKDDLFASFLALILAITPWSVHFARVAYEVNLALFFWIFGLYFFEILVEKMKHKKPVLGYSLLVIFCWSLTVFTYHAFQIFTPIMAVYLFFSHYQLFLIYFKQFKKSLFINLIFLFIWVGLFIFSGFKQANTTKFSGLSIFSTEHYSEEMFQNRQQFAKPNSLWAKLYSNDLSVIAQQLTVNIFKVFSADFLFIKGGNHLSHNVSRVPNLYPFEAFLIALALIFFIQEKKPWQKLVLFMIIAAIIAPIITFEANHSTRAFPLLLPLSIMAAYGLRKIYLKRVLFLPTLFVLVYAFYYFVINYFMIAPHLDLDSSNWYMKQLTTSVWQKKDQYDFVVFNEVGTTPYIYFLYYLKYQPSLLSHNLVYYPQNQEGFHYAKRLENIYFINDEKDFQNFLHDKPTNFLYVSRIGGDSLHVTNKYSYQVIMEVADEKSKIVYQLLQVNRQSL
jgi:4-amino-4-deoxy-L-arabinose transferase-like glycosyltransferase